MMIIELAGNRFDIPEGFEDIRMSDFIRMSEWEEKNMPDALVKLYEGKINIDNIQPEQDIEILRYYRNFVAEFTKIPTEVLDRVKLSDPSSLGIMELYHLLKRFLSIPEEEEITIKGTININGNKYMLAESAADALGNDKPLPQSEWIEYEEASTAITAMGRLKEGQAKVLPLLTAILYRPVISTGYLWWKKSQPAPYEEKSAKWRAFDFERLLNMEQVWSAYFFLEQRNRGLLNDTLLSLKRERGREVRYRHLIGILRKKCWQKKAYSTRKD